MFQGFMQDFATQIRQDPRFQQAGQGAQAPVQPGMQSALDAMRAQGGRPFSADLAPYNNFQPRPLIPQSVSPQQVGGGKGGVGKPVPGGLLTATGGQQPIQPTQQPYSFGQKLMGGLLGSHPSVVKHNPQGAVGTGLLNWLSQMGGQMQRPITPYNSQGHMVQYMGGPQF